MTSSDVAFIYLVLWVKSASEARMGFEGLKRNTRDKIKELETSQVKALNEALLELSQIVAEECKSRETT